MLWFTLDLYRHQQLKVYEWHLAKTNLETTKPHRTKITATACKFCLCTTHYRRFKVNRWRRLNQIKNIGQGLKFDRFFFKCTEDGYKKIKWIGEHRWKLHFNPKFLQMAKANLYAKILWIPSIYAFLGCSFLHL